MSTGVSGDQEVVSKPSKSGSSNPTPFAYVSSSTSTTIPKRPSEISSDDFGRPSKIRRIIPLLESRVPQERKDSPTTIPKRDVFWPRDLLPSSVPNARVLTYGYDTKIRHRIFGPASQNSVTDHGWDLLSALEDVRRGDPSRPLLFMAHSLGGLVLKIALMKSRESEHAKPHLHCVMASTVGIFFFGTPHRGADPLGPGLRRILKTLAIYSGFQLNDKIIDTLMPGGEYLREIRDSFLSLAKQRKWIIYSFQEAIGVGGLVGKKVVDDESSRLDEPEIETHRHISSNHMDMVRFISIEDNEYRKVEFATRRVIDEITSLRPVLQNNDVLTSFTGDEARDQATAIVLPLSPEKLQAREEMMSLLYFDEIDARLLTLKMAHNTTCRWLLEKPQYREWLNPHHMNDHHGFMWIKGKPGAGKSILMKFLDKDAGRTATANCGTVVISFFFNARGEQLERTTLGLYRSLLWQLLEKFEKSQAVLDVFDTNAQRFIQRSGWQIELLKQTLANAFDYFRGKRELRLFIDALDECSDDDVADMVSFFEDVGERAAEHNINLRICFSSRYYPTISVRKGIEIKLDEEEEHSHDIVRYIKSQLKLGTLGKSKKAEELRTQILEKSAGIFLWVALVIPMLNKACAGGKVDHFQKCLNEYPSGLHDLFEMIVARDEEDLDELRLCVQWVLFAIRPLKIEEYYFALRPADDSTTMNYWNDGEITQDDLHRFLSSSSKGFAELTKTRSKNQKSTVQFIHESVREFFLSRNSDGKRKLWPHVDGSIFASLSHNTLRTRCLQEVVRRGRDSYPNLVPQSSQLPKASSEDGKALRLTVSNKLPFLEYATSYVFSHADIAVVDCPQDDFLQDFPLVDWINSSNVFAKYSTRRYIDHGLALILYAQNSIRLLEIILARRADFGISNRDIYMVLSRAAEEGDERIAELCLKYGARLQSKDAEGPTPLSRAAKSGHCHLVKLLLEAGADVDVRNRHGDIPLIRAASEGHLEIVKLLLEKGADVDVKNRTGETSLSRATSEGHLEIVKLLLEKGAEANSKGKGGRTPLSLAAGSGIQGIVKLLLAKGAEVDSRDYSGYTPLREAAQNGHEEIVKLLLEKGAEATSKDEFGCTPLREAAMYGHEEIVKLLLEKGAKVDSKDIFGCAPLQLAAIYNYEEVVKLLLEKGAEVDSRDSSGYTPLWAAAVGGCEAAVKLLLQAGGRGSLLPAERANEVPAHIAAILRDHEGWFT
ncbi:hypothetical protein SLS53_003993 [Cytospora paraplurivora]|uniref:Nephrocystin 3-like N-terminal domain-containing protein n=1 Tax=Cytospora paraplurivora TaxID=2898453 RepID=A0AAN9UG22_9PEZI